MENELEQLGERIAEQAAHLDAAMHRLLTDLRSFDLRGGAVDCQIVERRVAERYRYTFG